MNHADCFPGLIVVAEGKRSWRIAIVLEHSERATGKVRICVWSATAKRWSSPQCVKPADLELLPERLLAPLDDRHAGFVDEWRRRRDMLAAVMHNVVEAGGQVRWPGGYWKVTSVRTEPPRPPAVDGVTKLAPVVGTVSDNGPEIITDGIRGYVQEGFYHLIFGGSR